MGESEATTSIKDAGLKYLVGLQSLISFSLQSTPITNVGLIELSGFTKLSTLYLNGTQIPRNAIRLMP